MTPLSLDCLTLPDVRPAGLFGIAAEAGYSMVSLWVQGPALYPGMLATPDMEASLQDAMAASGVTLGNLEVFNLNSPAPVADFERALAFGAGLGARTATAINFGPSRADMPERLAMFEALCTQYGLHPQVEPISMGATRTLADGVSWIRAASATATLVVDFLHLIRTGGSAESLSAVPADLIRYVQLCDGPRQMAADKIGEEASADRLYPGEGAFPLVELLHRVPPEATMAIEAPNKTRLSLPPVQRARDALTAAQKLLG